MKEINSYSDKETFKIGEFIGKNAYKGMVIALNGDLGAGKTVFTKGFAKGLEISEVVNSPTFTILNIYDSGRIPFYHYDAYRVIDIDEMEEIGYEIFYNNEGVAIVEWSVNIEDILPENCINIDIIKDIKNNEHRLIRIINWVNGGINENFSNR